MSDSALLGIATLEFDRDKLIVGTDTDIRQGLSAVALHGQDLWLACDEGCRLERLSRTGSELTFSAHRVFPLESVLALPAGPKEEADVEGMDIDGGWLWLVGSHSVKRKKPKKNDSRDDVAAKLATTQRDGNRHLLARIPLDRGVLQRDVGGRRAGSIATSTTSSALLDAIVEHDDPHLSPFIPLPGKDNGLDIEGLAVRDMRAFVGLRGPVLREWCCILELCLEADDGRLRLMPLNGAVPYRKHFLKLNGLGVRDLLVLGDDLLILAGPSMAHDGPTEIWRWKNGAKDGPATGAPEIKRQLQLPQGEGTDRAEGFTLLGDSAGTKDVLVVFDSPANARQMSDSSISADLYRLP